jgi:hypothetical protein
MGGGTWLLGGGIAYNSLLPWNVLSNDANTRRASRDGMVFSAALGEIAPGRLLYHAPHLRSTIKCNLPSRALRNNALLTRGEHPWAELPVELRERSGVTDPLPPLRNIPSQFYVARYTGEVQTLARFEPDVDTLYYASGGDAVYNGTTTMPIMTHYHGSECGTSVFSGFPLWYFQRPQQIQLVDFVLQRLLHLERRIVPR